jgi:hypothetical protein
MTDTIHVTAGQWISVTCNSFNFGLGTVANTAVVEALPIANVKVTPKRRAPAGSACARRLLPPPNSQQAKDAPELPVLHSLANHEHTSSSSAYSAQGWGT